MEEETVYTVKGSSSVNKLEVTLGSFENPNDAYDFIKLCFNESLHNKESYYNWTKYTINEERNGQHIKEITYDPDYASKKLMSSN